MFSFVLIISFQCLEKYVLYSINTGNVLKLPCPDPLCTKNGYITKNEVSCVFCIISKNMLINKICI